MLIEPRGHPGQGPSLDMTGCQGFGASPMDPHRAPDMNGHAPETRPCLRATLFTGARDLWQFPIMVVPRVPAGFVKPDLHAQINLDALIADRASVRVRGMFIGAVQERCRAAGMDVGRPAIAFKLYPFEDHVRLLEKGARLIYPTEPTRKGIWLLAHDAFDALLSSTAGRVVFGILGKDIQRITRAVTKAYEIGGEGITATLVDMGDNWSRVRIAGAGSLLGCYHTGAFRGVITACGFDGDVHVRDEGQDGELFSRWWPRDHAPEFT